MPRRPDPLRVADAMCSGLALAVAVGRITTPEGYAEIETILARFSAHDRAWILDSAAGMFLGRRHSHESLALEFLVACGTNVGRARQLYDQLHAGPGGVMGLGDQPH